MAPENVEEESELMVKGPVSPEFLAGLMVGIRDHLKRQDRLTAKYHTENKATLEAMEMKLDTAALDHHWIEETGKPLAGRVAKLETAHTMHKGKLAGVALAASAITAALAAFGKSFLLALAAAMK
jgi:hypothetical protein